MTPRKKPEPEDLHQYRKFGLTVLQLMALLFVLGIVGAVILKFLFS